MIDERDEIAGCEIEGRVGGGGDMAVLLAHDVFDSWIPFGGSGQEFLDVRFGRSVVREAKLPVGIELGGDRVRQLLQELWGCVIRWDHQADLRTRLRKDCGFAGEDGG